MRALGEGDPAPVEAPGACAGGNAREQPAGRSRRAARLVLVQDQPEEAGAAEDPSAWPAHGASVTAPASGRIAALVTQLPDGPPTAGRDPVGNHVVLDLGAGEFLWITGLAQATPDFTVGDAVEVGAPLGTVGWSAAARPTWEPHLGLFLASSVDLARGGSSRLAARARRLGLVGSTPRRGGTGRQPRASSSASPEKTPRPPGGEDHPGFDRGGTLILIGFNCRRKGSGAGRWSRGPLPPRRLLPRHHPDAAPLRHSQPRPPPSRASPPAPRRSRRRASAHRTSGSWPTSTRKTTVTERVLFDRRDPQDR